MHCFYKDFTIYDNEIEIEGEELRHFRALRGQKSELVTIVNGKGLAAIGYCIEISKQKVVIKVNNFVEKLGEIDKHISLAVGILDNKERFEFALEKGIELRISKFIPLITEFTQRKQIDLERLERKAISSMKQTIRSYLPLITPPIDFNTLLKNFNDYDFVFVLDRSGERKIPKKESESILIVVGPEGGLSAKEINLCKKKKNTKIISLGDFRLRTETATISFLSVLNFHLF